MKSKTNLGGAIMITGTSLIGVGTLAQLTQLSPTSNVLSPTVLSVMWYIAATGFVLSCIGKGVTAYYAADSVDVANVANRVENVAKAVDTINQTGADSTAKTTGQQTP